MPSHLLGSMYKRENKKLLKFLGYVGKKNFQKVRKLIEAVLVYISPLEAECDQGRKFK